MRTEILAAAFFPRIEKNRVRTNLWALVTINYPGAQINVGSCNAGCKKRQDPGKTKSKMTTATFCPFLAGKILFAFSLFEPGTGCLLVSYPWVLFNWDGSGGKT